MSARIAIWWLLPLSPLGIVLMLVGDGVWDLLGFMLAAVPLAAGVYAARTAASLRAAAGR